jgi:hypothetical protein
MRGDVTVAGGGHAVRTVGTIKPVGAPKSPGRKPECINGRGIGGFGEALLRVSGGASIQDLKTGSRGSINATAIH